MAATARVFRIDQGTRFEPPTITSQGFLRAEALLTAVGVYTYRLPDGSLRRELRHPEDVFAADSLATLSLAPLTERHPPVEVTAGNVRQLGVGTVGENPEPFEGAFVKSTVLVTDPDARARVESGEHEEVSCGYDALLEFVPGVWPGPGPGGPYDARQRDIRYNHAALEKRGRMGHEVRLRLDSEVEVGIMTQDDAGKPKRKDRTMRDIIINGVNYSIEEQVHQAITRERADTAAKLDAEKGRADAAEKVRDDQAKKLEESATASAELQKKLDAAADPATQQKLVRERSALVDRAVAAGIERTACDSLEDDDVQRLVIGKVSKRDAATVAGYEGEALAARYEVACERLDAGELDDTDTGDTAPKTPRKDSSDALAALLGTEPKKAAGAAGGTRTDAADARARMVERSKKQWQGKNAQQ